MNLSRFGLVLMFVGIGMIIAEVMSCRAVQEEIRRPLPQPPGESPEPPIAPEPLPPDEPTPIPPSQGPPLSADDERIFQRLRARIDQRVDDRLVEALNEANDGKKKGPVASALVAALTTFVSNAVKLVVAGLVLATLKALLGQWALWLLIGFVVAVALIAFPVGWLSGRMASGGKS